MHVGFVSAVLHRVNNPAGGLGEVHRPGEYARRVTDAASADTVPSLARRFGALLVDWLLCLLISGFFVANLRTATWQPVVVLIAEYGLFLGLFAQTPGMRLTKIKCVDVEDGGVIGVVRGALRGALLSLVVPGLIMDKQRRGLHDRIARSVVVPA
jgi:uncharacterized RDD family membrane protein YckC